MKPKPQKWIVIRQFYGSMDGALVVDPETFDTLEKAVEIAEKIGGQAAALVTLDEQEVRLEDWIAGKVGCASCGSRILIQDHKFSIQPAIACPCGAHYRATVKR